MRCPDCHHPESKVIDSRTTTDEAVRRRRQCLSCGARFTTHERLERRLPWVVKRDGRREPFEPRKVVQGIALACRKRPVDAAMMDEAVRAVESRLEQCRDAEVPSSMVGEAVMLVLHEVDPVAYVRFASVYRAFESIEQFASLIDPMRLTEVEPAQTVSS